MTVPIQVPGRFPLERTPAHIAADFPWHYRCSPYGCAATS